MCALFSHALALATKGKRARGRFIPSLALPLAFKFVSTEREDCWLTLPRFSLSCTFTCYLSFTLDSNLLPCENGNPLYSFATFCNFVFSISFPIQRKCLVNNLITVIHSENSNDSETESAHTENKSRKTEFAFVMDNLKEWKIKMKMKISYWVWCS